MKKHILIALLLLTTACTSHISDVTAISTRKVSTQEVDLNKLPMKKNIEGQDHVFWTIFNPSHNVKLSRAVEDALDKGDGDLMLNAEITLDSAFAIIGFINTLKIKGDVVNTKAGKGIK